MKHKNVFTNKKILIPTLAAVVTLALGGGYLLTRGEPAVPETTIEDQEAQTTSEEPSAQADFSGGSERTPVSNERSSSAVVNNTNGEINSTPPKSQWTVSSTGQITLYEPADSQQLVSGDTISGKSSFKEVNFRLIDNVSGVIATGSLPVKNGKFSGTFSFDTSASEGRLDVFGIRNDGTEFSTIELPIRF